MAKNIEKMNQHTGTISSRLNEGQRDVDIVYFQIFLASSELNNINSLPKPCASLQNRVVEQTEW